MSRSRIEPMAGRHIDAVMAIDAVSHSRQWTAAAWRKELAASDRRHLVVVDDGEVRRDGPSLRWGPCGSCRAISPRVSSVSS